MSRKTKYDLDLIKTLIQQGLRNKDIVATVGCSHGRVSQIRKQLKEQNTNAN